MGTYYDHACRACLPSSSALVAVPVIDSSMPAIYFVTYYFPSLDDTEAWLSIPRKHDFTPTLRILPSHFYDDYYMRGVSMIGLRQKCDAEASQSHFLLPFHAQMIFSDNSFDSHLDLLLIFANILLSIIFHTGPLLALCADVVHFRLCFRRLFLSS